MIFCTTLNITPGNYKKAIRQFKAPVIPEGVKIRDFLWMFGVPDAFIIFEATDEPTAGEFVIQFGDIAEVKTSVVFPIDDLRWVP